MNDNTIQVDLGIFLAALLGAFIMFLLIIAIIKSIFQLPHNPHHSDPHGQLIPVRNPFSSFFWFIFLGGLFYLFGSFDSCSGISLDKLGNNASSSSPKEQSMLLTGFPNRANPTKSERQLPITERINVSPSKASSEIDEGAFREYDSGDLSLAEKVEPHFVQISVARNIEDGIISLNEFERSSPGQLHIAYKVEDKKFPYKILMGPFADEQAARNKTKKGKDYYYRNLVEDGLVIVKP